MDIEWLDHEAYEPLNDWYRKYYAWLCGVIESRNRKYIRRLSNEEISDIAFRTFDVLYREYQSGKFVYLGDAQLKKWLKQTAQFTLLNYLKNQKGTIQDYDQYEDYLNTAIDGALDPLELEESDHFKKILIQTLNECINELSSENQTVVNLYYYGATREKVKKIALIMNQKESWVKGRLFQIRKKIKKKLAEKGLDDEQEIKNSI